jgi:hypothetical protein
MGRAFSTIARLGIILSAAAMLYLLLGYAHAQAPAGLLQPADTAPVHFAAATRR